MTGLVEKNGLSMATALPVWDAAWRRGAQKMGGEPPVWIQIFPYPNYVCTIDGRKKTLVTDDASQRSCVQNFDVRGNAAPIDYEHATTTDGVFYAPAAGRIVRLVAGGRLGLLGQCEWCEDAAADIRMGRYYVDSPTFWWSGEDDRVYVFVALALTNLPGSYSRPYLTDHNQVNYPALLTQSAAKGSTFVLGNRPLQLATAKGGSTMGDTTASTDTGKTLSDSVLNSIRWAFDCPLTTTGNDLRKLLQTMIDLIPASDDPIFMVEEASKAATTVGQLLGLTTQKASGDALAVALKPIRVALSIADEKATGEALALEIVKMKATTVPVAEYQALEQKLAGAAEKTTDERVKLKVAECKARGIGVTPHHEAEALRMGAQSLDLATAYLEALPPLNLAAQSAAPPPKETPAPATTAGSSGSALVDESARVETEVRQIMAAEKVSYPDASRLRLERQKAAAGTDDE